jgi:hypothetical protein
MMARYGRVDVRIRHLRAPRKAGSRKAVAIRGPIVSIVAPCFGQTGMECGQDVVDLA